MEQEQLTSPFVVQIAGHAIAIGYVDDFIRTQYKDYMAPEVAVPEYTTDIPEDDIKDFASLSGIQHPRYLMLHAHIANWLLTRNVMHIHASALAYGGKAYLFAAPSGTGKSTHTKLWRETFGDNVTMICDDKPFLRFEPDGIICCGSPWNGKHGIGSNIEAPLGAICSLRQGAANSIARLSAGEAFFEIHRQVVCLNNSSEAEHVHVLMDRLCHQTPVFCLTCTATPEAARLAREVLTQDVQSHHPATATP